MNLNVSLKMLPSPSPEKFNTFNTFNTFAIFNSAREYPILVHRQKRPRSGDQNTPARRHSPLSCLRRERGLGVRAAPVNVNVKMLLSPAPQKFNTFNTFNTFAIVNPTLNT